MMNDRTVSMPQLFTVNLREVPFLFWSIPVTDYHGNFGKIWTW